jgi:tetratricopeptide (TPR) repeat protein
MIFNRLMLIACFLVCFLTSGMAQDETQVAARAELNAGVQAFRQAHYEVAIDHFEHAVTLEPESTLAHLYLATSYAQMFMPGVDAPENVVWATKALDQYSEILRRNPSDIHSIEAVAYLQLQLKNFDQAKESYAKAIALDPTDPGLLYAAAAVNWSIANRDITAGKAKLDAESEYSVILSEGCGDLRTASLAGIDSGIAMLTRAITLRPDYADAMSYMNLLYRLRADLECGNRNGYKADLKESEQWSDRAAAARKKKADVPAKPSQEQAPERPRL